MLTLLTQLLTRLDAGEPLALCTLVRTRGSTPQKPGAVMLVLRDGQILGTIGGGCVEAEVRTRALRLMNQPGVQLLTFKLNDDHGWDDGLVCGGTMDVAVQVFHRRTDAADLQIARDALQAGHPVTLTVQAGEEKFSRQIEPIPTLIIAGAGHVGTALAVVARQMDFEIIVLDDRRDYASPERFPQGVICRIGNVPDELAKLTIGPSTYIVIVTRGHRNDGRALTAVIHSPAKYIGLIGSKRKVITIFEDLRSQGVTEEQLSRVHAPIGVNIAAVTPAEIAVSIAAELVAIRRGCVVPLPLMRLDYPTGGKRN